LIGQGKVADYIPALAEVPNTKLGIAVYTNQGEVIKAGDADEGFSIQSISKALNAGAIVVADMLSSRLSAPRQRLLDFARQLSGEQHILYDKVVAASEMMHSDRNAAIAYLMRSFGNFHNDVLPVLNNYFHACALKMSCVELAKTFSYLANKGVSVHTGEEIISPTQSKQVNALLAGVGGGIVAIVPGEMTIAVWSPELDAER